jgi:hypothetical protein
MHSNESEEFALPPAALAGMEDAAAPPSLPRVIPTPPPGVALKQLSQPGASRWIDRRRVGRTPQRLRASLQPVDATGALRSPVIYVRDLDEFGAGFISHHDVSAMGVAELMLAAGAVGNRRPLHIRCNVRRCRELPNRWFEGLLEFVDVQKQLAQRQN